MRQRRDHTSVQREPGLQQATTPGVRTLLWLLTQRVASACSVLLRMLRPGAWLTGALRSLHSIFDAVTSVMYPKRRQLLAWVRAQLPTREIADLSAMWRDGGLLCALVETAVSPDPRLCCHLAKYRGANTPSLRLGQKLAAEYLQVPPAFSEAELEMSPTPAVISRLADYLSALKHASQKLHELKYEKASPNLPRFVAKGMGLFMAVKGRNATFSVFPSGRRTLFPTLGIGATSLTIIIRGPDKECERIEVTPRGAQAKPKLESCSRIPISVITSTEACRVTYKPQSVGQHEVCLQYQEINLANSPYRVNVEAAYVLPETPVRNEKIRNMRVVDFIDEKHILTDTGKLIPLPKETPLLPSNPNKNMTFKGRVKHVVTRRKLIGSKKSKYKSFDEKDLSQDNEQMLERRSSADSKTDFKDTCKRILSVCDFLLKSSNKSKTLNIINTAEQILSCNPDLVKRNLYSKKSVQLIGNNEDTTLLSRNKIDLTEDEEFSKGLTISKDSKVFVLRHMVSEPIALHRKYCNLSELDRIVSVPFDLKNSSPRKVTDHLSRNEIYHKEQQRKTSENVIEEKNESLISKDIGHVTEAQDVSKIVEESENKSSESEASVSNDIAMDAMNFDSEEGAINDVLENFKAPSFETKVKEWMGPAEREIWENELRWYEEVGEDFVETCGEIETMVENMTRDVTEAFKQVNIISLIDDESEQDSKISEIAEPQQNLLLEISPTTDTSEHSYQEETKLMDSSNCGHNENIEQLLIYSHTPSLVIESNTKNSQILEGSDNSNNNEINMHAEISKEIFGDANLDAEYLEILKSYEENDELKLVEVDCKSKDTIEETETFTQNNKDIDTNEEKKNKVKSTDSSTLINMEINENEKVLNNLESFDKYTVPITVIEQSKGPINTDIDNAVKESPPENLSTESRTKNHEIGAIEMISDSKQLKSTPSTKENIVAGKVDFSLENDEIQNSNSNLKLHFDSVNSITTNNTTEFLSISDIPNIHNNVNESERWEEMKPESIVEETIMSKESMVSCDEDIASNEDNDILSNEVEKGKNENRSPRNSTDSVVDATRRLSLSLRRLGSIQDDEPLRVPEFLQLLSHSPDIASIGSSRVITPIETVETEGSNIVDTNRILYRMNEVSTSLEIANNAEISTKHENGPSNELIKDKSIYFTSNELQRNDIYKYLHDVKDLKVAETSTANQRESDALLTTVSDDERDKTFGKTNVVSYIHSGNKITNVNEDASSEPDENANGGVERPKNNLLSESNGHDSLTCILEELERERNLHHSNETNPHKKQSERRDSLVIKRKHFWDTKISQSSIENQQKNIRSRKHSIDSLYYASVAYATPTLTPDFGSRPSSPLIATRRNYSKSESPMPNDNILISLNSDRLNNITQQIINFENNKEISKSSPSIETRRKISKPNIFESTKYAVEKDFNPVRRVTALSLKLKHDDSSFNDTDSELDNSANDISENVRHSARHHDQMLFKKGSITMKRDSLGFKRYPELQRQTTQDHGDVRIASSSNDLKYRKNLSSIKKDINSEVTTFDRDAWNSFEKRNSGSLRTMLSNSPKQTMNKSKHFANVSAKFESLSYEEKQYYTKIEVKRTEDQKSKQKNILKKIENKFYSVGKMIMNSNSVDLERNKLHFAEKRIKSYDEGSSNESSQEGSEFHSVKYTTTAAKVTIVPSRRNSKATMGPALLSQFSLQISPDLVIETSSVNPLCDMIDAEPKKEPNVVDANKTLETVSVNPLTDMVDLETKAETSVKANKKTKVTSEESRDRFESAKNFFKNLEKGVVIDKPNVPKIRRLSECARIVRKDIEPVVQFSSVRQPRLSERFHVKDLFRDIIEDKAVNARGIPNREAAVASLNSVSVPPLLSAVVTKPFSRIIEDSTAEIF